MKIHLQTPPLTLPPHIDSYSDSNSDTAAAEVTNAAALRRRGGRVRTKWGIYADVVVDRQGLGDYRDLKVSVVPSHKSQVNGHK